MSEFSVRLENTLKQVLGNLQIILGDLAIPLAIILGPEGYIKSHLQLSKQIKKKKVNVNSKGGIGTSFS